ncbi:hypothetical protein K438DRAFT_1979029 [Mycena galopus ATCC 62051]|nr:hypothetical protein K438DRAFT_1979029 [Mycena galopus ATCC 62051]
MSVSPLCLHAILRAPLLWAHIYVSRRSVTMPLAIQSVMDRCRGSDLYFRVILTGKPVCFTEFMGLMRIIIPDFSRSVFLDACLHDPLASSWLAQLLAPLTAPKLRAFAINFDRRSIPFDSISLHLSPERCPVPMPFAGVLPSILSFSMKGGFLQWPSPPHFYSSLRPLQLGNHCPTNPPPMVEWVALFRGLPALVSLQMDREECISCYLGSAAPTLACLTHLEISGYQPKIFELLCVMGSPALHALDFESDWESNVVAMLAHCRPLLEGITSVCLRLALVHPIWPVIDMLLSALPNIQRVDMRCCTGAQSEDFLHFARVPGLHALRYVYMHHRPFVHLQYLFFDGRSSSSDYITYLVFPEDLFAATPQLGTLNRAHFVVEDSCVVYHETLWDDFDIWGERFL